jgi:hypothetical protein
MTSTVSIAAVGDISFTGPNTECPSLSVLSEVIPILKDCNIMVGNLESPLVTDAEPIPGKCTLHGDPRWAEVLRAGGIILVSLANNHMMDYGETGLFSTIQALDSAGIKYLGAGRDKKEACAPLFLDIRSKRIAFLARTSVIVSSPCYATGNRPGVAFLDIEETKERIRACRQGADLVIVLMHWGLEEYSYPSPSQRRTAKGLIEAGADLILGHHPHVMQGFEKIGHGLVAYSLGNVLFDDIQWSFFDQDGQRQDRLIKLSKENRKGGILKVAFSENGIESYEFIPTYIEPGGPVRIENTLDRKQEFSRLCSRLHWPGYSALWRLYSISKEWELRLKPISIGRLKWANLKKVRPKHFRELWEGMRRSGKITSEKSTNPYE